MAEQTNKSFLGSGMKFPPQANNATGRFAVSEGAQSVKESVYLILMTAIGERELEPQFGSRLSRYAFMDVNLTNLNIMRHDITDLILAQEPRISDVDVEIDATSGEDRLIVNIQYRIAQTNAADNFVFPFYLKAMTEEDQ
ncbi:MAG: GPW/gp25 family protein [Clostridiales Family XIII bacterium]|jgi:phage baseplate assembly protein W|nr:GPW/gp25 family protein [Clostridiales Family XIII bacterium]